MFRLFIVICLVSLCAGNARAQNAFEECRAALRGLKEPRLLLVVGETHGDAEKDDLHTKAHAGELFLGLEGVIYGHSGRMGNKDNRGIITVNGVSGPVIGIEESVPLSVASNLSSYHDFVEMAEQLRRAAQLAQGTPLAAALGISGPIDPNLMMQAPQFQRMAKLFMLNLGRSNAIWAELRATPFTDPQQEAVAHAVDEAMRSGAQPRWANLDAVVAVMKAYAVRSTQYGQAWAAKQGIAFPMQYAMSYIENPRDEKASVDFFRHVANDFRNEPMAQNIARAAQTAYSQGKDLVIVVGAMHVRPLEAILKRELGNIDNLSIETGGHIVTWEDFENSQRERAAR